MDQKVCPMCNGSGVCSVCKGSGKASSSNPYINCGVCTPFGTPSSLSGKCRMCKGTGSVADKD